ncbi:uncharacterized protein BP01DRAFT_3673 [Aspergillus saccharolyticus JOP 1030-1]|uniref:Uncharacterized protein n=1 Tax=Aspergillus saccharolyticus JOP 1030-1 TaxID=1450539 RepID=A0A318ZZQ8_9EURO|nr:hypothetical protein BP01DRAFT_3673 [Aspergillus saccharolyticus JOP 1030-1]PYH49700.1 hypothetical protein BP01DRAFT_3673 [Aspergillus saccharolyticus JOP 1030-1]
MIRCTRWGTILSIAFMGSRTISLPFPRQLSRTELTAPSSLSGVPHTAIPSLLESHNELLPKKYVTLSSEPWATRSLLHDSTFLNADIECNSRPCLVESRICGAALKNLHQTRSSQLPYFLRAILTLDYCGLEQFARTNVAESLAVQHTCRDRSRKIIFQSLNKRESRRLFSARRWWIYTTAMTKNVVCCSSQPLKATIDLQSGPGNPLGATQLCETRLMFREHVQCAATHCLEYKPWEWL